jgi:hypothetical protein
MFDDTKVAELAELAAGLGSPILEAGFSFELGF